MKGIYHGILNGLIIVLTATYGCALTGGKPIQSGPVRGDSAITGDLTNASIAVNDWKMVIGIVACFCISGIGFLVIGRMLVKHHAAINRVTSATPN